MYSAIYLSTNIDVLLLTGAEWWVGGAKVGGG